MNEDVVEDDELYDRVSDLLHYFNQPHTAVVPNDLNSVTRKLQCLIRAVMNNIF